jgi:hypothetical protein
MTPESPMANLEVRDTPMFREIPNTTPALRRSRCALLVGGCYRRRTRLFWKGKPGLVTAAAPGCPSVARRTQAVHSRRRPAGSNESDFQQTANVDIRIVWGGSSGKGVSDTLLADAGLRCGLRLFGLLESAHRQATDGAGKQRPMISTPQHPSLRSRRQRVLR